MGWYPQIIHVNWIFHEINHEFSITNHQVSQLLSFAQTRMALSTGKNLVNNILDKQKHSQI